MLYRTCHSYWIVLSCTNFVITTRQLIYLSPKFNFQVLYDHGPKHWQAVQSLNSRQLLKMKAPGNILYIFPTRLIEHGDLNWKKKEICGYACRFSMTVVRDEVRSGLILGPRDLSYFYVSLYYCRLRLAYCISQDVVELIFLWQFICIAQLLYFIYCHRSATNIVSFTRCALRYEMPNYNHASESLRFALHEALWGITDQKSLREIMHSHDRFATVTVAWTWTWRRLSWCQY